MITNASKMLCSVLIISWLFSEAISLPDPNPDFYSGYGVGWGLAIVEANGDDYLDIISCNGTMPPDYGASLYVRTGAQQPPYFTLNCLFAEYHSGREVKFGQLRPFPNPKDMALENENNIYIYRNDQSGVFGAEIQALNGMYFQTIAWGDVNSDGYEDLVAEAHPGILDDYIYIYYAYETGFLNPTPASFFIGIGAETQATAIDFADLRNTGLADMIISYEGHIKIFLNDGTGTFLPDPQDIYVSSFHYVNDFAVGDINNDDLADIVVSHYNGISNLINDGSGYFILMNPLTVNPPVNQIDLAEFNYDGHLDLVKGNYGGDIEILPNLGVGDGEFNPYPIWTGTLSGASELKPSDLDNNGSNSIIAVSYSYSELYIFKENTNQPPCPPRDFEVGVSQDEHPLLSWRRNTEPDFSFVRIYRAVTQHEEPQRLEFDPIHDEYVNTYWEDPEVNIVHVPYVTDKIWYYITALDNESNESMGTDIIRFWAEYDPLSEGGWTIFTGTQGAENTSLFVFPNPFNPSTVLSYLLQDASYVNLTVYDNTGRQVAELVDDWRDAGVYELTFDASSLPSGIYFARIEAGNFTAARKLVLVK